MSSNYLNFDFIITTLEEDITIDNLDVEFDICKNNKLESNRAYLNIWNLSDVKYNTLMEKDVMLNISISFGGEDPTLLFCGKLDRARVKRGRPWNRVDVANRFILIDGADAFCKFINKNYRELVNSTKIIQDCISLMGVGSGRISENLPIQQYESYKLLGYPQDVLEKICTPLGISFSIQNNLVDVISPFEVFQGGDVPTFNASNTLKLNNSGKDEVTITTGLTSLVNPNDWVECDYEDLKGVFQVNQVRHYGNNYGKVCLTEITVGYKISGQK